MNGTQVFAILNYLSFTLSLFPPPPFSLSLSFSLSWSLCLCLSKKVQSVSQSVSLSLSCFLCLSLCMYIKNKIIGRKQCCFVSKLILLFCFCIMYQACLMLHTTSRVVAYNLFLASVLLFSIRSVLLVTFSK